MYINAINRAQNEMALLIAPTVEIEEDTEYCLEYWVHNYGKNIGQVAVLAQFKDRPDLPAAEKTIAVSNVPGDRGDRWVRILADIDREKHFLKAGEKMSLQFIGVVGSGIESNSAIDDIRLHKTPCRFVCPSDQDFTCDSGKSEGKCVAWEQVCDGQKDCENDEDEINCRDPMATTPASLDFTTGFLILDDFTTPVTVKKNFFNLLSDIFEVL